MAASSLFTKKVVLVGDAKVGKTAVVNRWASGDAPPESYEPTVSPEFTTKEVQLDGCTVRMQVWDMGFGEPDSIAQFPHFVGGCTGALLMYDASDASSMDGVAHWHQQVSCLAGPSCLFVVVGCKADCTTAEGVTQRARAFAESIKAEHIQTSALNGINTTRVFESLARGICLKAAGISAVSLGSGLIPDQCGSGTASSHSRATTVACSLEASSPTALPEKTMPSFYLPETTTSSIATKADSVGSTIVDAMGPPKFVKLVLLGDPEVGKSSLAARLGNTRTLPFQEDYVSTAGPEFLTRQLHVNQSQVKLQVWEAGGQDLLQDVKMRASVLQGADAVMILYDITSQATFDNVKVWMQLLAGQVKTQIPVMLVGNKADCPGRAVAAELGRKCSDTYRIPFMEHSAKFGGGDSAVNLLSTLLAAVPPDWSASTESSIASGAPVASGAGRSSVPLPVPSGSGRSLRSSVLDRLRAGRSGLVDSETGGQLTPRMRASDLVPDDGFSAAQFRAVKSSLNAQLSSIEPKPEAPRQKPAPPSFSSELSSIEPRGLFARRLPEGPHPSGVSATLRNIQEPAVSSVASVPSAPFATSAPSPVPSEGSGTTRAPALRAIEAFRLRMEKKPKAQDAPAEEIPVPSQKRDLPDANVDNLPVHLRPQEPRQSDPLPRRTLISSRLGTGGLQKGGHSVAGRAPEVEQPPRHPENNPPEPVGTRSSLIKSFLISRQQQQQRQQDSQTTAAGMPPQPVETRTSPFLPAELKQEALPTMAPQEHPKRELLQAQHSPMHCQQQQYLQQSSQTQPPQHQQLHGSQRAAQHQNQMQQAQQAQQAQHHQHDAAAERMKQISLAQEGLRPTPAAGTSPSMAAPAGSKPQRHSAASSHAQPPQPARSSGAANVAPGQSQSQPQQGVQSYLQHQASTKLSQPLLASRVGGVSPRESIGSGVAPETHSSSSQQRVHRESLSSSTRPAVSPAPVRMQMPYAGSIAGAPASSHHGGRMQLGGMARSAMPPQSAPLPNNGQGARRLQNTSTAGGSQWR